MLRPPHHDKVEPPMRRIKNVTSYVTYEVGMIALKD
jgi:hypothetical protein